MKRFHARETTWLMDADATQLFVCFPGGAHEGRSVCSTVSGDKRGSDWRQITEGKLQLQVTCMWTKSVCVSVADTFIFSITLDSASFQWEKQLKQE